MLKCVEKWGPLELVEQGSEMSSENGVHNNLDSGIAIRLLITAAIANLVFKSGIVWFAGGWKLILRVGALFLIPIACGVILICFW